MAGRALRTQGRRRKAVIGYTTTGDVTLQGRPGLISSVLNRPIADSLRALS